jgi:hypothetical protein
MQLENLRLTWFSYTFRRRLHPWLHSAISIMQLWSWFSSYEVIRRNMNYCCQIEITKATTITMRGQQHGTHSQSWQCKLEISSDYGSTISLPDHPWNIGTSCISLSDRINVNIDEIVAVAFQPVYSESSRTSSPQKQASLDESFRFQLSKLSYSSECRTALYYSFLILEGAYCGSEESRNIRLLGQQYKGLFPFVDANPVIERRDPANTRQEIDEGDC